MKQSARPQLPRRIASIMTAMRPIGWAPPLFAASFGLSDAWFVPAHKFALTLLALGPFLAGSAYTLNFMADARQDRISDVRKDLQMSQQPFSTGRLTQRQGLALASILAVLGLCCLALVDVLSMLLGALTLLVSVLYSYPPRFKTTAGLDVAANAVMIALCYLVGRFAAASLSPSVIFPVLWILLLVGSTYLLTEIIDYEADKTAHVCTTTVRLGAPRSIRLAGVLYFLSIPAYVGAWLSSRGLHYIVVMPAIVWAIQSFAKRLHRPSISSAQQLARRATLSAIVGVAIMLILYVVQRMLDVQVSIP